MKFAFLFFIYYANLCFGVRLNPLENNDKLQGISNQYIAEWQWESWPIKQESSEQDSRSPGVRINVALWKDGSGPNWYLFGGHPVNTELKKIYSDVWKYSTATRIWERFFPSQVEVKGSNVGKIGGMMTLRANLFDEGHNVASEPKNYNVVLCGGVAKANSTKTKKQNVWNNFTRRKKEEEEEEGEEEKKELRSLAVYAPKTSKSNTVWQIDLKDKLWTAYVCCCDTSNNDKKMISVKPAKTTKNFQKAQNETAEAKYSRENGNLSSEKNESAETSNKINKAEDEADREQQHLIDVNSKNKKKKINQSKKSAEDASQRVKEIEKRSGDGTVGNNTEYVTEKPVIEPSVNDTLETPNIIENVKFANKSKKEKYALKIKSANKANKTEEKQLKTPRSNVEKTETTFKPKMASKYCPEFSEGVEPVTWCDGNSEVLITADITSPQIILWVFNLKTSHWSQLAVKVPDDIEWPGCSDVEPVRYAGNEDEVYVICSSPRNENADVTKSPNELTNLSKNPSKKNAAKKIVYQINYKRKILEYFGEIEMRSYFSSVEGREIWENDTKSLLQIVRTPQNDTILLLAYLDSVDLWLLTKNQDGKPRFESVEKIWRGSALKWFNKYNAALYNFQFTVETGNSETVLMPNPRIIGLNEYWPRDRGRFIIRIFKNENLKNQSFENRTREQNLTYELLQSDYKPPAAEAQLNHAYSFKVLIFFGISLAIFTVFGFVLFLKRCVTCPPRIRNRNECHKSPLVIRYSVIPDDLLYPVA